jgi:anthranilate synthase/aminodeoxychorismate synthase-like glutamine amidotransferase
MLLMIDNYDSFTFTLVNYFESLGQEVLVKRNDEISVREISALSPQHIVVSPGPGKPEDAAISKEVIKHFYKTTPILGVCLGHQVIAQQFGARVSRAANIMHGKTSEITHSATNIFHNLPNQFDVTRYHSLIVEQNTLPDFIEPTAWVHNNKTDDYSVQKELMALALKDYPVVGVQFHPESVMSEHGLTLLDNFLRLD